MKTARGKMGYKPVYSSAMNAKTREQTSTNCSRKN